MKKKVVLISLLFLVMFMMPINVNAEVERIHDEEQFKMLLHFEFDGGGDEIIDDTYITRSFNKVVITTSVDWSYAVQQEWNLYKDYPSLGARIYNKTLIINGVAEECTDIGLTYDSYTREEVEDLGGALNIEISAELYCYDSGYILYDTHKVTLKLETPDYTVVVTGTLIFFGTIVVIGIGLIKRNKKEDNIEKMVKTLILCPYCGKKYEQGLNQCPNCLG